MFVMKKVSLLLWGCVVVVLCACTSPAPESYTFLGHITVEFVAPRHLWPRDYVKIKLPEHPEKGTVVTKLVFSRPDNEDGKIVIQAGAKMETQQITDEMIRLWRLHLTEDDWQITEFEWLEVAGAKAYSLEYKSEARYGKVIYFVAKGYLWSVEMQAGSSYYKDTLRVFDRLVDSFRFVNDKG